MVRHTEIFNEYKEGVRWVAGNGQRMVFWEERWCRNTPLKLEFPTVYSLAANPLAAVADYVDQSLDRPTCVEWMDTSIGHQSPWKEVWYGPVTPKVQFFMWTVALGKISTTDRLQPLL